MSKAMTFCTGKKNKYSSEIVVTEVYGVCGEEDHETLVLVPMAGPAAG